MSSPSDRCCAVDSVQHIVPFGSDPEIHMLTKPAKQGKILLADDHPWVLNKLPSVMIVLLLPRRKCSRPM